MAGGSVEPAREVFWQCTLDLHHYGGGCMQEEWHPGYSKMYQELQPHKDGRMCDRTSSLLMRRVGQLESLTRV